MFKKGNTFMKEYKKPTIEIEDIKLKDVLTASDFNLENFWNIDEGDGDDSELIMK